MSLPNSLLTPPSVKWSVINFSAFTRELTSLSLRAFVNPAAEASILETPSAPDTPA